MPAFEGEDIDKMKELMDEEAMKKFREKKERVTKVNTNKRLEEIEELNKAFGLIEEDDDGILGKMDGS